MSGEQSNPDFLTSMSVEIPVPVNERAELTVREIVLVESLLTPGLQTAIKLHSYIHSPVKNLDLYKNQMATIKLKRPSLAEFEMTDEMEVQQRIYRLSSRKLIDNNNEEFVIHCCDDTLLNDARTLVSDQIPCGNPSDIVRKVLSSCVGASNMDIEDSGPARPYYAENIHPFQVIAQQADVALAASNDPSFTHFMTYEDFGTHHFKSLHSMTQQDPIIGLSYTDTGHARSDNPNSTGGYRNPRSILTYSFPCDFDLLSDLLNGVDVDGSQINSLISFNEFTKTFSLLGNQAMGCGVGGGSLKMATTNQNSAEQQDTCPVDVESHLLKRQARMGLLNPDKVALRVTVPWNPMFHVGKVIEINLYSKEWPDLTLYGSGKYLISVMQHTIKQGGYSTTTMDCVSVTTGTGSQ